MSPKLWTTDVPEECRTGRNSICLFHFGKWNRRSRSCSHTSATLILNVNCMATMLSALPLWADPPALFFIVPLIFLKLMKSSKSLTIQSD